MIEKLLLEPSEVIRTIMIFTVFTRNRFIIVFVNAA